MTRLSPASVRALLEPALDPDEALTWADVEARLIANTAQLWTTPDAAMITEIEGDAIHVWLGGGSLRSLLNIRPRVEAVAREWGLKRATIHGRLGWGRVLKSCGYERRGQELEKRL